MKLPDAFQRKIDIDNFVSLEACQTVVDLEEYRRLKIQQGLASYSCSELIKRWTKKGPSNG